MQKNFTLSYSLFISERKKSLSKKTEALSPFLPDEITVQNILNFSKAMKVEKTKSAGVVELYLN